ncbi:MAG: efflux RND transporter permease subunit, partial [Candidatus Aureabacteria bacterium]|nr:efflux RND transporter permease subunit [Candidatus Auribacterota bacterium]
TPDSINREEGKRTTSVDADLRPEAGKTPLEVAGYFESSIFPKLKAEYPSTILEFGGEVKDTRESQADFVLAIILVLLLIYVILALLFDSLIKPFIIMLAIPFGIVGVILAFWLHGITLYGFFAIIGVLGLAGVVVNDAIIMVVKLDREFALTCDESHINRQIAGIAKTRLRAVLLTTLTTVAGMIPTAYGFAGYDAMLAQMMLSISWGLLFATFITLIFIPCLYGIMRDLGCIKIKQKTENRGQKIENRSK